MKALKLLLLIVGFVVFVTLVTLSIITLTLNDNNSLTKVNILTQLIYTFVTTILVILTYSALKTTQEQKHQAVRPYLVVGDLGIYKNAQAQMRNEVDFNIYNEGHGLALNINVQVKRKFDGKIIYKADFTRLNVQDNPIYGALCEIRNEINLYRNDGGNGTYYPPYIPYSLQIDFPVEGDLTSYLSLIIELSFSNIYGKKYRNTFQFTLDNKELEVNDCIEEFSEL